MSLYNFDTMGLPVITNDTILYSTRTRYKDKNLILQTIITTFVFLIIIIWFTLVFNVSTRGIIDTDYYFLQFAVYFTLFAIISIYFLMYIKSIYAK